MVLLEIIEQQNKVIAHQQEQIHLMKEELQALRDEVARLKGEKGKPKIPPSQLEKPKEEKGKNGGPEGKRPGSEKESKTKNLIIHETKKVEAVGVKEGSIFKGYLYYTVQDLAIAPHNIRYQVEYWQTPEGQYLRGKLPKEVDGYHFGPTVRSYVLYQYYQQHVTQPLILEGLKAWGVEISAGQVNQMLTEGKEEFHREKDRILEVGLQVSNYINVDDTGARHDGKNGYATHIGGELFSWFASTGSKSRVNFLELLRAGHTDYVLSEEALAYMKAQGLPEEEFSILEAHLEKVFETEVAWQGFLGENKIGKSRHVRMATEGALLGSVLSHGFSPETVILSDDAGQFNILLHALCWVHAERTIRKLVGFSDGHRQALEKVRTEIWDLYRDLKAYKIAPDAIQKIALDARFDAIFSQETCFISLNLALKRLLKNKTELLVVLERPEIPLHNNASENDIREYVKRRKVSGSTRSDLGRQCRDTFVSLKKTCRKLKVSFWDYLLDRVSGAFVLPQLPDLILAKSAASG